MSKELLLRGSSGLGDQLAVSASQGPFQRLPLLDPSVVRAGLLVKIEQAAPVDRVIGKEGMDTDEFAPVFVTCRSQGLPDAPDYDDVFPFNPTGWAPADSLGGPKPGRNRVAEVGLNVSVGHCGVNEGGDPEGCPLDFLQRVHGETLPAKLC